MVEAITRLIAAWRARRWEATWTRRDEDRRAEARRRAAHAAYENAHAAERIDLAQSLLVKAATFARTEHGRWACETYGGWPLGGGLEVDGQGRLWRRGEKHWFGSVPDKLLETPQAVAATATTATLRAAPARLEPKAFWSQALGHEALHWFGFYGRPA